MSDIKRDRSIFIFLKSLADSLLPLALLYCIARFYGVVWEDRYSLLGLIGGLLLVATNQVFGVYDNWRTRSLFESLQMVIKSWGATIAFLIILIFLQKRSQDYSRVTIGLWAMSMPFLLLCIRIVSTKFMRYAFARGFYTKTVAIVGAGTVGQYLAGLLRQHPYLGYSIYGYYDENLELSGKEINGIFVLGNHVSACEDAKTGRIDELYLCLPLDEQKDIIELMNQLAQTTVVVKYVPDLFAFDLLHAKWIDLKGLPVVSVYDTPMSSVSARFVKRTEDIFLATMILFFIWPLMILIAIGVKLSSPGPVFYRQTRIGWNGKAFTILKFRSMPTDVEKKAIEWGNANKKTTTKFGRLIRNTSMDELPQFFNVLKGDMSIVGPRPERDVFIEKISSEVPRYMQRHMVKAGITGWAQINGLRGDTSLKRRIEYDLYYISNWSFMLDLKIIFFTVINEWRNRKGKMGE